MKCSHLISNFLALVLLLIGSVASSEARADAFDQAVGVRAGSRLDAKNRSAEMIKFAKVKLSQSNHRYDVITGGEGDTAREVIVFSVVGSGIFNRLAKEVQTESPTVRLVYDPYPLFFGTVAFFDPRSLVLALSHHAMAKLADDESVEHERYHAKTYLSSLRGKTHSFSGEISTSGSNFKISRFTETAYLQFQSLDEGITQALSVSLEGQILERLVRENASEDELSWQLTLIHSGAEQCRATSLQVESVANQILTQTLSFGQGDMTQIDVYGKKFAQVKFYFAAFDNLSYKTSVDARSGIIKINLSESELKSFNAISIRNRFEKIKMQSASVARQCQALIQQIPIGLERVDVKNVNVNSVIQSSKRVGSLIPTLN